MKTLTVVGKIGKIYFAECPKCKKYIVTVTLGKVECEICNTEYLIEMSGEALKHDYRSTTARVYR